MNREQAINYLISSGFTHEQVGDVVRALTYEPTTKNDLSSGLEKNSKKLEKRTTKNDLTEQCIACKYDETEDENGEHCKKCLEGGSQFELDEALAKPSTKNDSGVDCISREQALKAIDTWDKFGYSARYGLERLDKDDKGYVPYVHYEDIVNCIKNLPSATPQLSVPEVTALAEWTTKLTKAREDAYNKGYADGVKSVNICPHCGEYIGEEE